MMPLLSTVRHAARRLLRAPTFTLATTLTLTLGVGATVAAFTVVNGVLLRPLPYPASERLVDLSHTLAISGITRVDQSDATYLLYRRESRALSDVAAYRATAVNLATGAGAERAMAPERVPAIATSASLFTLLVAPAEQGRALRDADGEPGAAPVVVVATRLAERAFGSAAAALGRRIVVDGREREIVGVMPARFAFPDAETAMWLPLAIDPANTHSAAFDYRGIARLRPGATIESATADLRRLLPRVPEVFPGRLSVQAIELTHMAPVVRPLRDVIVGDVSRVLWIVLGAVGVLLLVACANVANLFLARAESRHRELAIRITLGAGRGLLLADSLAEAVLVSVVGGALGLAGAEAGVRVLRSLGTVSGIPRIGELRVDGLVLAVTAGIALLVALGVGVVPLLRARRLSFRGATRHRGRRALVVAQVALALILVAAAGLFARSFARLRAVDPGFAAEHALALRIALPDAAYPTTGDVARTSARLLDAIAAVPGVQSTGMVTKLPLASEARQDSAVFREDETSMGGLPNIHQIVFASPSYFDAAGIPLLGGRLFERLDVARDLARPSLDVIVSDAFARRYWPGRSALGKRIRMNPQDPWHTIVGVVGSVRDAGLDVPAVEAVYAPLVTSNAAGMAWSPRDLAIVVRTTGDPVAATTAVRAALRSVDPSLPPYRVTTMRALVAEATARTTLLLVLLAVAAAIATAVGALGNYAVISYLVSLRTREIGVRLALGATARDVRRLVARQVLRDATVGVALGLGGAAVLTRTLAAALYDVSPLDPATLGGASVLLLVTAVVASWVPARRAAALDPARTLRAD